MINQYFILYLNIFIIFGILFILFIPNYYINFIKKFSIFFSFIILFFSLFLLLKFNSNFNGFNFTLFLPWLSNFNIYYSVGLDGISIFFIILTTFLIPICILISWYSINFRFKEFLILLFFIELMLINLFSTLDLFFFYIFFESILIPIFLIIGIWGSRQRKIHAAYQLFFYTLVRVFIHVIRFN